MEAPGVGPGKKHFARRHAHLVFVDESGFQLIPTVRRTWAPRGQTPVLRHWQEHDRVSVISGVSLSPRRRRYQLYFQLQLENLHTVEVAEFLVALLRQIPGPVFVVWDNTTMHRGPVIAEVLARFPRLDRVALPGDAPELNPAEGVWRHNSAWPTGAPIPSGSS